MPADVTPDTADFEPAFTLPYYPALPDPPPLPAITTDRVRPVVICDRCRGRAEIVWYNAITGQRETWPCILCRPAEFDAKEAAEGLTPKASEEAR